MDADLFTPIQDGRPSAFHATTINKNSENIRCRECGSDHIWMDNLDGRVGCAECGTIIREAQAGVVRAALVDACKRRRDEAKIHLDEEVRVAQNYNPVLGALSDIYRERKSEYEAALENAKLRDIVKEVTNPSQSTEKNYEKN